MVLDLVLAREPFDQVARILFKWHEQGAIDAYIAAITPVNVFYIVRKLKGIEEARQAVKLLLVSLTVCPLHKSILDEADKLPFADYEDAVQHASATASELDFIVTRDVRDYKNARLPVLSPREFLAKLKSQQT
ncbi:MAG TPA: PIN domain-containing protein [Pyrinomonadaceae bacterium]|nr:PIN domain-containing protein [Pyrinomonadaceae bacterium]